MRRHADVRCELDAGHDAGKPLLEHERRPEVLVVNEPLAPANAIGVRSGGRDPSAFLNLLGPDPMPCPVLAPGRYRAHRDDSRPWLRKRKGHA